MIIIPVHFFVAFFHNVLPQCIVDTFQELSAHGMVLPGSVYGRSVYGTKHEVIFGRCRADLFLQNVYNGSLVVDYTFRERSSVFF